MCVMQSRMCVRVMLSIERQTIVEWEERRGMQGNSSVLCGTGGAAVPSGLGSAFHETGSWWKEPRSK